MFPAGIADFVHAKEKCADTVAAAEVFAGDGLVARNQCIQFAGNNFNDDAMAFYPFDRSGNDVFFDGEKFVQVLFAFGIADTLQDDLFGGLRGLAAETFVRQPLLVIFADLDGRAGDFFLDFLDGFFNIGVGIVFIGHNQPAAEGLVFAGVAVDLYADIHVFAVCLFLGCARECEFQGLEYDFCVNIFFACQSFCQL